MHEVSIADSILDLIEHQIGAPQALAEVELCVGPLSGVSADSLEFCFATVAKARGFGTPTLSVQRTQVHIRCESCQTEYAIEDLMSFCPQCNSWKRTILSGDELQLLSAHLIEESHV
jgi:hydrogenase nickel incorporation protein HypA/HybF